MTKRHTRLKQTALRAGIAALLAASAAISPLPAARAADIWTLERQAKQDEQNGNLSAAAEKWHTLLDYFLAEGNATNAALYAKSLGHYYDGLKNYDQAIYYYELENENWLKLGNNWGAVDIERAGVIRTTLELYMSTENEAALINRGAGSGGGLAKFEPLYGAYIGMYSESDPQMGNHYDRSEQFYGRKHALYLAYTQWGKPFPAQYAKNAKASGAALQIAFEPTGGLSQVQDGDYIREWARQAKESGIPIFLRYASEMNGQWTVWNGDPAAYIAKFKLVHDIMAEEAPNVAMVWSPGDVPHGTMAQYYPGDAYVDWVGVSMYTEPYENGDPAKPGLGIGPVERLNEIYWLYADRKPVMISETAVAHLAHKDGASFTEWAAMNLDRVYSAMTKKYPRLKAITYFNRDQGNANSFNDYLLRDNDTMMSAYKRLISQPYFLTKVETGAKPAVPAGYVKAEWAASFARKTQIMPYVKLPDVYTGRVDYWLNGMLLASKTELPYSLELAAGSVPPGSALEVKAYNQSGELAASRTLILTPQVTVTVNGKETAMEQPPVLKDGSTLAPVRAIFNALGAEVEWNAATQTATGRKNGTVVSMTIGNSVVKKNGAPVKLEAPPELINGYTMVPARFVGEAFGAKVEWEGSSATVRITSP